jgi:hypothetical protein
VAKAALHRTTIDVDIDLFEAARDVLGTKGFRDTIDAALKDVVRRQRLRTGAALIRGAELDLVRPEELAELRRSRPPET